MTNVCNVNLARLKTTNPSLKAIVTTRVVVKRPITITPAFQVSSMSWWSKALKFYRFITPNQLILHSIHSWLPHKVSLRGARMA
jgi:hypothetical protein